MGIRLRLVADVRGNVEAGEAQQPPDAGLGAGDNQFTAVSGQAVVRPCQDGKAGAVGEAKRGQVRDQGLRRAVQDAAMACAGSPCRTCQGSPSSRSHDRGRGVR